MSKKKIANIKSDHERLRELAECADITEGALDDELYDCCQTDADLAYGEIIKQDTFKQLLFMYVRGYGVGRLEEIVAEAIKKE